MLIGEVARLSGVSARMLRHYDSLGLVSPSGRTPGGYRDYTDDDLRRLAQVGSLTSLGLTLRETASALDDPAFAPAALVDELMSRTRERIVRDQELLARLDRVDASDPAAWDEVLRIVALLRTWDAGEPATRQRQALASGVDGSTPAPVLASLVLAESDVHVAGALRWALARSGDASLAALADGLDDPDARVRHRAVLAIAALPGEPASVLGRVLDDPDLDVRDAAALAVGTPDAVPALVDMVVAGRHDVDAGEALGRLAAQGHAHQVVDALGSALDPSDADVRVRIVEALAEVVHDSARALLAELVRDADPVVAGTARHVTGVR